MYSKTSHADGNWEMDLIRSVQVIRVNFFLEYKRQAQHEQQKYAHVFI